MLNRPIRLYSASTPTMMTWMCLVGVGDEMQGAIRSMAARNTFVSTVSEQGAVTM